MRIEETSKRIEQLVDWAIEAELAEESNRVYVRNQLMALYGLDAFSYSSPDEGRELAPLLEQLSQIAVDEGLIADLLDEKDKWKAKVMNVFLPRPSDVQFTFEQKYAKDPISATDYFYWLSQKSNYIQMDRIAKNVHFTHENHYGDVDITINLSKPEKDPKDIEAEKEKAVSADYPLCVLCKENEGYAGRIGHPARSNHRLIRVPMQEEMWYLQYSPYIYYNEHAILLSEKHRDMVINRDTFKQLLSFIERFPHYFIGSNADLPIVGGSILSHDHYQGGRYTFALEKAAAQYDFTLSGYPEITAQVVEWPMTVLRLRSSNQATLVDACEHVHREWKGHEDADHGIIPYTGKTPHNTITPIARWKDGQYEVDLVLRNNRTNEEYPDGIFHPHEDVHHIKKENIGLNEVMGLAVLPKRLVEELEEIQRYIQGATDTVTAIHQDWAEQLKKRYGMIDDEEELWRQIEKEVGAKFMRVLEDAGVYKQNEDGREGLMEFIGRL
ncbi:UDPglucose--hexose-1-phosphate uridylyltransferase [Geomicrobium halophilum]|uniref:Galactose-1-phosphate uridylyltransferase n=1 Tax=Geomicrobium halophilum TaxID=549000 RepID=A0A841Q2N6_9BACL|nr:UDP-glucose--hexose-1-phosphate uridylyltransferase [Geomicrobium halophilum]MBB6450938.1 UDPglucose--hexose-1-phosphate uridylyltransferase [Geomicrobium halophilum]